MAAGFDPPDAALRTIAEWRGGKLRALRSPAAQTALETVLPELVRALGAAPDPQATLLRFDKLVSGLPSAVGFFHLLAAQPELARIATRTLSLAPTLADALAARVQLIEGLIDQRASEAPAHKPGLIAAWARGPTGRQEERLADGVRDRVGARSVAQGVQL